MEYLLRGSYEVILGISCKVGVHGQGPVGNKASCYKMRENEDDFDKFFSLFWNDIICDYLIIQWSSFYEMKVIIQ